MGLIIQCDCNIGGHFREVSFEDITCSCPQTYGFVNATMKSWFLQLTVRYYIILVTYQLLKEDFSRISVKFRIFVLVSLLVSIYVGGSFIISFPFISISVPFYLFTLLFSPLRISFSFLHSSPLLLFSLVPSILLFVFVALLKTAK